MAGNPTNSINNFKIKWKKKGENDWEGEEILNSDIFEFNLIGLNSNQEYEICIIGECTNSSNQLTSEVKTLEENCETPNNLISQPSYNSVDLSWNNNEPSHFSYYNLKLYNEDIEIVNETTNNKDIIINGLTENTNYKVYLQAICSYNNSNIVEHDFNTLLKSCSEPINLELNSPNSSSINVNWDVNIGNNYSNVTEWIVKWHNLDYSSMGNVNININTYTINGLLPYEQYFISVQSKCINGTESSIIEDDIKTLSDPYCHPPINMTLLSKTPTSLTILIENYESGGLGYDSNLISWKKQDDLVYSQIKTTSNPVTINGLDINTEYEVKISAVCGEIISNDITDNYTTDICNSCIPECDNSCNNKISNNLGVLITKPTMFNDADTNRWVTNNLIQYPKKVDNCLITNISDINLIGQNMDNYVSSWNIYSEDDDYYYIEVITNHLYYSLMPPPSPINNIIIYDGDIPCSVKDKQMVDIFY